MFVGVIRSWKTSSGPTTARTQMNAGVLAGKTGPIYGIAIPGVVDDEHAMVGNIGGEDKDNIISACAINGDPPKIYINSSNLFI